MTTSFKPLAIDGVKGREREGLLRDVDALAEGVVAALCDPTRSSTARGAVHDDVTRTVERLEDLRGPAAGGSARGFAAGVSPL